MTERPIVHTYAEYMAICLAEGVSPTEAYRSYRHAYRCALSGRSWDYEHRLRTTGVKSSRKDYGDASFATEEIAT